MRYTKIFLNNRLISITGILILILFTFSTINVSAHSPSDMNLSYNTNIKELEVSITHQVADPDTHYVFNITIKINDETIQTEDYSSQPGSSFTYLYEDFIATEDDKIEVTAQCNLGGSITETLTVTSEETSKSTDDDSTPGFELVLIIFSIICIILILKKYEKN
jgi:desulfoferrodoxin (superoxide reductase-like protein)